MSDLSIRATKEGFGAIIKWNYKQSCGVSNYKTMIYDSNDILIMNKIMGPNETENGQFELKDKNHKLESCKTYVLKIQPEVSKRAYKDGLQREFKYININSLNYRFEEHYFFKEGFIKFFHKFECIEVYEIVIDQGDVNIFNNSATTSLGNEISVDLRNKLKNCENYKLKFHPKWTNPLSSDINM